MGLSEETPEQIELMYTTIYSQAFSPCGKYLAACSNFGRISLFSLMSVLSPNAAGSSLRPAFSFEAQNGCIYCLLSTEEFLISAGSDGIKAWSWTDLHSKMSKISWTLSIPTANLTETLTQPEVNSIALNKSDGELQLFAGCGDNLIHCWDVTSGTYLGNYVGHSDYVHCLAMQSNGQQFFSGSEDGSVRIWDARRKGEAVQVIEPYKEKACSRPQVGKWIGCLAVDRNDDWMVCGGGLSLSLWYLRSASLTTTFERTSSSNSVLFHEDLILSGGNEAFVNHWSANGRHRASVPCSATNVFNISVNTNPKFKIMSVAGNSPLIDIYTNFGYKALSLSFR